MEGGVTNTMSDYDGENAPTVLYGDGDECPIFFRVCPKCGKYVKADEESQMPAYTKANATCKKCGRVIMPFCCWLSDAEHYE